MFAYFHDPDKLLNTEKGHDATKNSKPNRHIMRVMSTFTSVAAYSVNFISIQNN